MIRKRNFIISSFAASMIFTINEAVFAHSEAIGVDSSIESTDYLSFIPYLLAIVVFLVHATIFTIRWVKRRFVNHWIFWGTAAINFIGIPLTTLWLLLSIGGPPNADDSVGMKLLVIELVCLIIQLISWKFKDQPYESPIP